MSTHTRLTLWYAGVLALVLLVFSLGTYWLLRQSLYMTLDESLENRSRDLVGLIAVRHGVFPGMIPDPVDQYVRVYDAQGKLAFSTPQTASYRVRRSALPDGGVLEVGIETTEVQDLLWRLTLVWLWTIPLSLLVASLVGAFMARRALRPIDELTRMAQRITAEDLSQRIDTRMAQDEVGRLATTLNAMIARLESAFARQRQFTADASHELRTPLTILKGQLDVALQRERTPEEYRAALVSLGEQTDRMIRLVGSLLTLSRAESGQLSTTFEPLDAGDLVTGAVEQMSMLAEERGVPLRVEGGPVATFRGDEDLLLQLILNLIDNALKAGGSVTVGWTERSLWVRDTGVGIAPEHLPQLFERFYRVDKSRSRAAGGTGLGLAIGHWIAQVHGGALRVESAPGRGSTFRLEFN